MRELSINWNDPSINARMRFAPPPKLEPPIDEVVSRLVGKKIYQRDPRLVNLVVKWKKSSGKSLDSMEPDNFFNDKNKVEELKKVLC